MVINRRSDQSSNRAFSIQEPAAGKILSPRRPPPPYQTRPSSGRRRCPRASSPCLPAVPATTSSRAGRPLLSDDLTPPKSQLPTPNTSGLPLLSASYSPPALPSSVSSAPLLRLRLPRGGVRARAPPDLRSRRLGWTWSSRPGQALVVTPATAMRRGVALLLVSVFAVAAVAKGSADTPPAETNGDSSSAQSGLGKLEQHDQTNPNPNKEHVTNPQGVNNDIGDNKKDNSTEVTNIRREDSIPQPKDKDDSITKPSQARDFLEDPLIKECDPSHRCIIENKKFIACLKVSGEDSSALSLLMDNRGINPLDVSLMAPDYVTKAEGAIHVEANGHSETQVRVSVSDDSNKTTILLKVAENSCNISIHNAITRETGRVIRMPLTSTYRMPLTSTYTLLPIFVLLAVVGMCIMLRRARRQDGEPAYQKLDMSDLPVSVGGKREPDERSDKWDHNWGDDWDDEEAPMTPSKPLPNPSSKGLAPRRSTKDGWKD